MPRLILGWLIGNARELTFLAGFAAVAGGFWMAWPPLGLIVPGAIVCGALTWSHVNSLR